MCNYNNYIFVIFVILGLAFEGALAGHIRKIKNRDYDDEYDYMDYDLSYDQRQNGTENYRLNIDGVVVALPGGLGSGGGPSSDTVLSALDLLAGELLSSEYDHSESEEDYDEFHEINQSSTTSATVSFTLNSTASSSSSSLNSENSDELQDTEKIEIPENNRNATHHQQQQQPPKPMQSGRPMNKSHINGHGVKHHKSHLISFLRPLLMKYRKSKN